MQIAGNQIVSTFVNLFMFLNHDSIWKIKFLGPLRYSIEPNTNRGTLDLARRPAMGPSYFLLYISMHKPPLSPVYIASFENIQLSLVCSIDILLPIYGI